MKPDLNIFRRRFASLSRLGDKDLTILLAALEVMEYPAGAVVMAPGYGSGSLFLVDQGSIEISLENENQSILLGELGIGSWFGEMALIDPAPASARVMANTDCSLLVLEHDAFGELRRDYPSVSGKLLQVINEGLAQRLHQTIQHIDGVKIAAGGPATRAEKHHWFAELARRVFGPSPARTRE